MISRLIPALFIIAALGLYFGYASPTYSGSIAQLRAEIRELDTALVAARQFKEKEVELTREREALPDEQVARLNTFLPDSVDNVQLILDLNALAARSGVQLSQFDIAGGEPDPAASDPAPMTAFTDAEPVESLELSVSALGSYAAFRTFLAGVEQSLRPLDIIELSVGDSETGVYQYDITFRLYWLQ